MKSLLPVTVLGGICIAALNVIDTLADVSAKVTSYESDGRNEVVTVQFTNRLFRPVTVSCDVAIGRGNSGGRYFSGSFQVFAVKHLGPVLVQHDAEACRRLTLALPTRVHVANAIVLDMNYR